MTSYTRTIYLLNSSPGGHSSEPALLRHYYSQVAREVVRQVAEVYHLDFTLFGYDKSSIFTLLDQDQES